MKTRLEQKSGERHRAGSAKPSIKSGEGVKVEKSVTINLSPREVYHFWRQLENLPRFMQHLESVSEIGEGLSHWIVKTSQGRELEWDAKIIEDKPDHMISWQSLEGADMDNAGSVWFTPLPGGDATVVKVAMKYSPIGGKVGAAIARIFGDSAEKQIAEDLLALKNLLEGGAAPAEGRYPSGGIND